MQEWRLALAAVLAFGLLIAGCTSGQRDNGQGKKSPPDDPPKQTGKKNGNDKPEDKPPKQVTKDPGQVVDPTVENDDAREAVKDLAADELIAKLGDAKLGAAAVDELVGRGSDSVEPLLAALDSEDPKVQSSAAFALGGLGPAAASAVDKLKQLQELGQTEDIRVRAAFAIDAIEGQ